MIEKEIIKMKIDEIKPNNWNPNTMDEKLFSFLKKQIKERGFLQPILVNKNNIIIDGEHRWRAAKEVGLKEIEVVRINVDDKIAKILTLNMNNIKGEYDFKKLSNLIKDLENYFDINELVELLNYTKLDLEYFNLFDEIKEEEIEEKIKNQTKPKIIKCPNCGHEFEV